MSAAKVGVSDAFASGPRPGREIIICVTFREFDGSTNDLIQRRFLDSLSQQTYRNFRLVVTNFREKNVAGDLERVFDSLRAGAVGDRYASFSDQHPPKWH